jgi:hypothetical protein
MVTVSNSVIREENIARMGQINNACSIYMEEPEIKRLLGKPRHK